MASVRKRDRDDPKSPWIVSYTDAAGVRRIKTPKSGLKKDADRIRQEIERELGDGTHVASRECVTLSAAVEAYLKECEIRHRDRKDVSGYYLECQKSCLRKIPPHLMRMLLTDITSNHIQAESDTLAKHYTPSTVKTYITVYHNIFRFAVRMGWLVVNRLKEQPIRLPAKQARKPIPSKDNVRKLLATLTDRRPHEREHTYRSRIVLVTLALFTTMRKGEIVGLLWENVDFVGGNINVQHNFSQYDGLRSPKTTAGVRTIAMSPPVRAVLETCHAADGRPPTGFVLRSAKVAGAPMYPQQIWKCIWAPLMRDAGLVDAAGRNLFTFHQVRHIAISMLIEQGLDPMLIKTMAGHSSITITMDVYGHLFPEDVRSRAAVGAVAAQFEVRTSLLAAPDATKTRHSPVTH